MICVWGSPNIHNERRLNFHCSMPPLCWRLAAENRLSEPVFERTLQRNYIANWLQIWYQPSFRFPLQFHPILIYSRQGQRSIKVTRKWPPAKECLSLLLTIFLKFSRFFRFFIDLFGFFFTTKKLHLLRQYNNSIFNKFVMDSST